MNESNFLEELSADFSDDELEEIIKLSCGNGNMFSFPVAYFGQESIWFNRLCHPYLKPKQKIVVKLSLNYVLFEVHDSTEKNLKNAFMVTSCSANDRGCCIRFPSAMRDLAIIRGAHKLYKSGKYLAVKRLETVDKDGKESDA